MTVERRSGRTKADVVYDALRDEITDGTIAEGEHLRQEDVARRWGVSATPVREAFRRLESDGLVRHEANRGVVVRAAGGQMGIGGIERLAQDWQDILADPESVPGSDFP